MQLKVLEILVDRHNIKWPWVFEHILIILHKVFEDFKEKKFFLKDEDPEKIFSFEITKVGNRIRFFLISPKKYASFLMNQVYAHYNDVEIIEVADYLEKIPNDKIQVWKVSLKKHFYYPIKSFTELQEEGSRETVDPYSSITSALWKAWKYSLNTFQINFTPVQDIYWKKNSEKILTILLWKQPDWLKDFMLSKWFILFRILISPITFVMWIISLFLKKQEETLGFLDDLSKDGKNDSPEKRVNKSIFNKLSLSWYKVSINIINAWEDKIDWKWTIREVYSTLWVFSYFWMNSFQLDSISCSEEDINNIKNRNITWNYILSTNELSWLVHLPTEYVKTPQINWVSSRAFEPPSNLPIVDPDLTDSITPESEFTPIWKTNFRWSNISFWIGPSDRRRHMYVLWKTWMWKSTLLENMIIDDIRKWRGVAVIDPHGDLAESIIGLIPKSRTNSTIIFDPSDTNWPIAFNMLEDVSPEHRPLIASWLVWIFKKIFWDSWWPRLEHILRNTILALLEYPNTTLISITLMLTSEVYRNKVIEKVKDPVVKKFWLSEFWKLSPQQRTEAISPILNKVGQFLSSTILRNVLWQPKNSFSLRWAMDNKKIVVINLSKWKIWEDASALLWAMMVTKFQLDAMSRADIPESERVDFYLYVDEFQNFATDSFATILSEARKYKLNLVMANQYIDQMQEEVRWAVFGNVWSIVSFQVWFHDANILKEVLAWEVMEEDLMNLKKYSIYTKQLIDWMPSPIFSASTFPPNKRQDEAFKIRYDKILNVSREKYTKPKNSVEEKINKMMEDVDKQEKNLEKKKEEYQKEQKEERAKKQKELEEKQQEEKRKREEKNKS